MKSFREYITETINEKPFENEEQETQFLNKWNNHFHYNKDEHTELKKYASGRVIGSKDTPKLREIIKKHSIPMDVQVHSGLRVLPKNGNLTSDTPISTAFSEYDATKHAQKHATQQKRPPHLLTLRIPKGSRVAYNEHGEGREVVIHPNAKIEIHKSEKHSDGIVRHFGTLINDGTND